MTAKNGDFGVFQPPPFRYATCRDCGAKIGLPDDLKAGYKVSCTHCNATYRAWQLLARSQSEEIR